jgi:hypothetical protein
LARRRVDRERLDVGHHAAAALGEPQLALRLVCRDGDLQQQVVRVEPLQVVVDERRCLRLARVPLGVVVRGALSDLRRRRRRGRRRRAVCLIAWPLVWSLPFCEAFESFVWLLAPCEPSSALACWLALSVAMATCPMRGVSSLQTTATCETRESDA